MSSWVKGIFQARISSAVAYVFVLFAAVSTLSLTALAYPEISSTVDTGYQALTLHNLHPRVLAANTTVPRVGQLVYSAGNRTVYLVGQNGLYGFPSASIFYSWGFTFNQILPENSGEQNLNMIGVVPAKQSGCNNPLDQINGVCGSSLLSSTNSTRTGQVVYNPKNRTVYIVGNNNLYGFTDANTFYSWGYAFSQVVPENSAEQALSISPTYVPAKQSGCNNPIDQINGSCGSSTNQPTSGVNNSAASNTGTSSGNTGSTSGSVSGNSSVEGLIFVVPNNYPGQETDYVSRINQLVTNVNTIYAKNTQKQFKLQDIRQYDRAKYCDLTKLSNECEALYSDPQFFTAGNISVFFAINSITNVLAVSFTNPLNVSLSAIDIIIPKPINISALSMDIDPVAESGLLAHELGHSYGLGAPELYSYGFLAQDPNASPYNPGSGVDNSQNTPLPASYDKDPMANPTLGTDSVFGPLDSYIINHDLDHATKSQYQGLHYSNLPNTVLAKVVDQNGNPVSGATVQAYCQGYFSSRYDVSTPKVTATTDSSGSAILQQLSGNDFALTAKNPGVFDNQCSLEFVTASENGYAAGGKVWVSAVHLEEAKLVNGQNQYVATVKLTTSGGGTPTPPPTPTPTPTNGNWPVGNVDSVNNSTCEVTGWAKDPNTTAPIYIHIYRDAQFYNGGTFIGAYLSNKVNNTSPSANNGYMFDVQLPQSSGLYDGVAHQLYIYGISATGSSNAPLNSVPATIQCPNTNPPIGSTITIFAAGLPAKGVYPTINLLINGQIVKTFINVQGDAITPVYQQFAYISPTKVTANQVQVSFTNHDYSTDSNGNVTEDRHPRIGKINIDGVDYPTIAPTTYSVGVLTPTNACQGGYYQSEWLECNGYFAYNTPGK